MKTIKFILTILLLTIAACVNSQNNYETIIQNNGGRTDWSDVNNKIAIDRKGADGFYEIYTMNPDTSDLQCLTCVGLPADNRHTGNPSWHPSGEYILFQMEDINTTEQWQHNIATPGRGRYNNVWVTDSSGTILINLTNIPYQSLPHYGVLHPHFSKDGTKILWAEMIANNGPNGEWRIKTADFNENSGNPFINNVQTYHPLAGINFYETHGFSQSGDEILFSATLSNSTYHSLEIYTYNTITTVLTNLTNLPDIWDEHAHYNKTEDKIVWMSSSGFTLDSTNWASARTEWWIMNVDGTNKQQLSHFNTQGYPEYIPDTVAAADLAFSPDGSKFFGYVITDVGAVTTGINVLADLSSILSVENNYNNINSNLLIYPNPTTGVFTINFAKVSNFGKVEAEITNISGKVLHYSSDDFKSSDEYRIDLSNQPKGVYFVKIITENGTAIKKIVLE